jgi:hypothetical protein
MLKKRVLVVGLVQTQSPFWGVQQAYLVEQEEECLYLVALVFWPEMARILEFGTGALLWADLHWLSHGM